MRIFKAKSKKTKRGGNKRRKKSSTNKPRRARPKGLYTYVYVLRSASPGTKRSYVGVTNDPMRRIRQHNGSLQGGAKYTKKFGPWRFHAIFRFDSRHDALSVEWKVKHRKSKSDGPPGLDSIVRRIYRHGSTKAGFLELVGGHV